MIGLIIGLIVLSQVTMNRYKRKIQNLKDDWERQLRYCELKTREETLNYVGSELHDNIGQLLALVKLNLTLQQNPKLDEAKNLISQIIRDVRNLAHSLNSDIVRDQSLRISILNEVERLKKITYYNINFNSGTEEFPLQPDVQTGLFRIFQECISNIIKHSGAKTIHADLQFAGKTVKLTIQDDGSGFDVQNSEMGIGISNMKARARVLGGQLDLISAAGKGSTLVITINV